MDCRDFLDRYSDYDDSLLDEVELTRFRSHLSACSSCARYDRVLRKGRMLARQLPRPEPGTDFVPRLQGRLDQYRAERRRRQAAPVLGGGAVALAAVTVVASSMWALSLLDQPAPTGIMAAPAVDAAPAGEVRSRAMLPVAEPAPVREWAAHRVDPRVPVSYSPLVMGPPVYRMPRAYVTPGAYPANITSTLHTLD